MALRTWTDEQFIAAVEGSVTIAQVCRAIGIKPISGNIATVKRAILRLGLNTDHFVGQSWANGKQFSWGYSSKAVRNRLKAEIGRCEVCLNSEWMGRSIPLEIDHIDGNNANNDRSNLRVLCPNCHAQTDTYRNRKRNI